MAAWHTSKLSYQK